MTNLIDLIESRLDFLVQEKNEPYADLFKAARYSLLSSGKRLRPLLLLTAVEALGGDIQKAIQPACALEMIHTYSLIHDDLPCMDNDDLRRGKPTLHKVFPEWQALLAGDFLLTYAFEVLATSPGLDPQEKIDLITLFANKAGGEGMVGGQVIDLSIVGKSITLEELKKMHLLKTGMLLQASLEAAAIIAKRGKSVQEELKAFGHKVGLAFQIIDDVIDVTEGIDSDANNDKVTYTTLLGVEASKQAAQDLLESAKSHLKNISLDNTPLALLADKLVFRTL